MPYQDIKPETAIDDLKDAKARLKGFAKKKVPLQNNCPPCKLAKKLYICANIYVCQLTIRLRCVKYAFSLQLDNLFKNPEFFRTCK